MFQRFTERARHVVVLAHDEARALKHKHIGMEHIVVGLVRGNEGVAAGILVDFGAYAETLRNEIPRMLSGPPRASGRLREEIAEADAREPEAAVGAQAAPEAGSELAVQHVVRQCKIRPQRSGARRALWGLG